MMKIRTLVSDQGFLFKLLKGGNLFTDVYRGINLASDANSPNGEPGFYWVVED